MLPDTRKTKDLLGSVELTVNGKKIIDRQYIDDILLLWIDLVNVVADLREGKNTSSYYPDQPIRYWFCRSKGGRVIVGLENGGNKFETSANVEQLIEVLRLAGIMFFQKIEQISNQFYPRQLRQLNADGY
ncbi:hypothetical protein [Amycolatopsis marina]|uniref:hypothetical protein n=1 Tax=Amycolatopsis marina TaxID=490629 RepID=UPI0011603A54|nr:hypothetical protein [Amycolatopsis marina]